MEKARLTREQADALEYARRIVGGQVMDVIETHVQEAWSDDKCRPLISLTTDEVCRAFYVGIEIIEEDQEVVITEKKRQEFRELQKTPIGEADYHDGVVDTLNFFGITIKGINA